jgi:hypothetical protein
VFEIRLTTVATPGHVVIDRPAALAECLSVLDGIVTALETVPGMHAQLEPTTPHPQVFVYSLTTNGWERVARYTITETKEA